MKRTKSNGKSRKTVAKTAREPSRKSKAAIKTANKTSRSKTMNDQFTRQAQDMFNAARDAKIPENFQALAEDNVARTREAYQRMNAAAKDGAKVVEEVVLTAQAGAKAIGDKILDNTVLNTEAAFDAAQAIARARTVPDAMRMQAEFMQHQFAIAGAQSKELFELGTKVARQTIESMNAAAQRSFDQVKKA